jgi:hypothetical protein
MRESEEAEPQMFTRYIKRDSPGNKDLPADGLAAMASAWLAETWQPIFRGGRAVRLGKRSTAHRVAAEGLRRERHTPGFGCPELVGANDEGRGASR